MVEPVAQPRTLTSIVVAEAGRVALIVGSSGRWSHTPGYTLVPLELPGAESGTEASLQQTVRHLGEALLGRPARVLSSNHVYGPSRRHAIDRLDAPPETSPRPLLRVERATPVEGSAGHGFAPVVVRAYRARLMGRPEPTHAVAGILWATPRALKAAMRGLPMSELLAYADVIWHPSEHTVLPEDALVYVPSEYGERHLLRIVAKYGAEALFQPDEVERQHE